VRTPPAKLECRKLSYIWQLLCFRARCASGEKNNRFFIGLLALHREEIFRISFHRVRGLELVWAGSWPFLVDATRNNPNTVGTVMAQRYAIGGFSAQRIARLSMACVQVECRFGILLPKWASQSQPPSHSAGRR
jgi:hypothetical protein